MARRQQPVDLRKKLNSEQLEAVTHLEGPALVIAGAGTGKTRVIEYRAMHLVETGVHPGSILLLTFTRRAANEMISRAKSHNIDCQFIEGGTFHSFASRQLREYGEIVGLSPEFIILDDEDASDLLSRCIDELGIKKTEKRYPKSRTIRDVIDYSTLTRQTLEECVLRRHPVFVDYIDHFKVLQQRFTEIKLEHGYCDYTDLLLYLRFLLEDSQYKNMISDRFRFLMVDEFQDTNFLEAEIALSIADSHKNIMAVGDDAQSIYGFKGAVHKNIMDFPAKFDNCKVITLVQNYRSTQPILNLANYVLSGMEAKYSKDLTSADSLTGSIPDFNSFTSRGEEASWIAERVLELREEGQELSDIAVLYRSTFRARQLEIECMSRNIPIRVFGGARLTEAAHFKDLIAHIKILVNHRDIIAWQRLLKLLPAIGKVRALRISNKIAQAGGIRNAADHVLSSEAIEYSSLKSLVNVIKSCMKVIDNPALIVERMLAYYRPVLEDKYSDWQKRLRDLEEFSQAAGRYDTVVGMLEELALEPIKQFSEGGSPAKKEDEYLTFTTIHSAKGLEWPVVCLVGVEDSVIPGSNDDESEIEEERRVLYVAITRPQRKLILTLSHDVFNEPTLEDTRIGVRFRNTSRFLGEDYTSLLNVINEVSVTRKEVLEVSKTRRISLAEKIREFRASQGELKAENVDSEDKI